MWPSFENWLRPSLSHCCLSASRSLGFVEFSWVGSDDDGVACRFISSQMASDRFAGGVSDLPTLIVWNGASHLNGSSLLWDWAPSFPTFRVMIPLIRTKKLRIVTLKFPRSCVGVWLLGCWFVMSWSWCLKEAMNLCHLVADLVPFSSPSCNRVHSPKLLLQKLIQVLLISQIVKQSTAETERARMTHLIHLIFDVGSGAGEHTLIGQSSLGGVISVWHIGSSYSHRVQWWMTQGSINVVSSWQVLPSGHFSQAAKVHNRKKTL